MTATATALLSESLPEKLAAKTAQIGVVGMGYVGLPLTLLYSSVSLPVTGFDIDETKVNTLNDGGSYIVRIESAEISRARQAGFSATTDYSKWPSKMQSLFACLRR